MRSEPDDIEATTMTPKQPAPSRGRLLKTGLYIAPFLALASCADDPKVPEPVVSQSEDDSVRAALGKITLDAAAEGQEVLGVQLSEDRGVVNLYYGGPAEHYVVCETAGWVVPEGGIADVNLAESTAFEVPSETGPVSVERWVRLDAMSSVVVRSEARQIEVEPKIQYIVSMVTEVYDLEQLVGRQAERLEFESGGAALTSFGHRCESNGVLENLAKTAAL